MSALPSPTNDTEHKARIRKLRTLFPEAFDGEELNFKRLASVLQAPDPYGLHWHGKEDAKAQAQTPSTTSLKPQPEQSEKWQSTHNLFIEGENLEVLKHLQNEYQEQVKLIFIDPPYNTGNHFTYIDKFSDTKKRYLQASRQLHAPASHSVETEGRRHASWLSMMLPRLILAQSLLKRDGVIFVSIDDNEVHHLRMLLNEVFGSDNFCSHIIWQHNLHPKGYRGTYSVHHNHILCFRKSSAHTIGCLPRTETDNKAYSNPDNDPGGPWRSGDVRNPLYRANLRYTIATPSGGSISPPENGWRWSRETLQHKIDTNEIIFTANESKIIRKIYLSNVVGRTPETIWFGKDVGVTRDGAKEIKALFDGEMPFDTAKPMALTEKMLHLAGVQNDDTVLDFFAGSCSNAHAVMRSSVGRFIAVQSPEPICTKRPHGKAAAALGFLTIADIGRDRLRRASKELSESHPHLDTGFRVYTLDTATPD